MDATITVIDNINNSLTWQNNFLYCAFVLLLFGACLFFYYRFLRIFF